MLRIVLLCLICGPIWAQNLVPNPGFEEIIEDPVYGPVAVGKSPDWFRVQGSIDFFHADYADYASVPANSRGHQWPATGNGYAGVIAAANHGEFLAVELTTPLLTGGVYDISFKANVSSRSGFFIDDFGATLLKEVPIEDELKNYQYSIRNPQGSILSDTTNWVTIDGKYIAEGGERYLLIGNLNRTPRVVEPNGITQWTYFYIDDVVVISVCETSTLEEERIDSTICSGRKLRLVGTPGATNHLWEDIGAQYSRIVKETGVYIVDSYFDCHVKRRIYHITVVDCDCDLILPGVVNQVNNLQILPTPNVDSFEWYAFDVLGRQVLHATQQEIFADDLPYVSAPYFWIAQLTCLTESDLTVRKVVSGKFIVQN